MTRIRAVFESIKDSKWFRSISHSYSGRRLYYLTATPRFWQIVIQRGNPGLGIKMFDPGPHIAERAVYSAPDVPAVKITLFGLIGAIFS